MAKKMLSIDELNGEKVFISQSRGTFLNMKEYELLIKSRQYGIVGEEYKILKDGSYKYDKILIFSGINSFKKKLLYATNSSEGVGLKYYNRRIRKHKTVFVCEERGYKSFN